MTLHGVDALVTGPHNLATVTYRGPHGPIDARPADPPARSYGPRSASASSPGVSAQDGSSGIEHQAARISVVAIFFEILSLP